MQGHMHHKRRLLIALIAAGGVTVGMGSLATTASAMPRTFVITLVGNIKKTVTVDVGADVPLNQIQLPSVLGLPILSIQEVTPAAQAPAAPAVPAAPVIAPNGTVVEGPSASEQLQSQAVTGKKKRIPRAGERALDTAGNVIG